VKKSNRQGSNSIVPANKSAGKTSSFQVSSEPVLKSPASDRADPSGEKYENLGELPKSYGAGTLSLMAKDSEWLFAYWDIDLTTIFENLGTGSPEVRLRALHDDGTLESETKIDPAAGNWHIRVERPGSLYHAEIGFTRPDGKWESLARSGAAAVPSDQPSEDLSADFTSVPFHLSFHRLMDIFRAMGAEGGTLVDSLRRLREKARALEQSMPAADWSHVLDAAADSPEREAILSKTGLEASELEAILRGADVDPASLPTVAMMDRWDKRGVAGESSWGDLSSTGLGSGSASNPARAFGSR
jgi:hypothetical protein